MSEIKERLKEACNGHPNAVIPWPHRLLHDAIDAIWKGEQRIALLDAVAEAAVEAVPNDPEDRTTEDTMLLEALRAAGYLREKSDE
jgi:hypothetical protein